MRFIEYLFLSVFVILFPCSLSAVDNVGLVIFSLETSSCDSIETNELTKQDTIDEEHLDEMVMANQKAITDLANQLRLNDSINKLNNELQYNKVIK